MRAAKHLDHVTIRQEAAPVDAHEPPEHLGFAAGVPDRQPQPSFQFADPAGGRQPLVEQPQHLLVQAVDDPALFHELFVLIAGQVRRARVR
jgi:hypothetical protein